MREATVNQLNNFIAGWYMDDTAICDDIVKFHSTTPAKSVGKVGNKIDLNVKDSIDAILDYDTTLYKEYCKHLKQILDLYSDKFKPFVQECAAFSVYEAINVQYYKPGAGFKKWHTERDNPQYPFVNRHLAFMTFLTDVEDGGETEFYYQQIKIRPEKGLTLMWGVDWTFTHRGIVSPTQEKYITTGWLSFKDREKESV